MSKNCKYCPARFEGEADSEALAKHVEGFHPAGAPVPVAITAPVGTATILGKDYGPAVSGVAASLADVKATVQDHEERLKAIEDGRRSSVDLTVLADQLAPRLGQPTPTAVPEPAADEGPRYRDLQARAKELGIPATGNREELGVAIAAEDLRLAEEARASRSGEGTQGGDGSPVDDPAALATGEAGTPPAN